MMAITHALIAATTVRLLLGSHDPMIIGLAILGSQLPDLDTSTSIIGQFAFPLSRQLERWPHRTVTHSFLAIAVVAVLSLPLWFFVGQLEWMALWLGMFFSIVADTFTVKGCQLFWPNPVWCYSGSSWDKKRLSTGGTGEILIAVGFAILLSWLVFSGIQGNLISTTGQQLGIKKEVAANYNRMAGKSHVWAEVKGVFSGDKSDASGRYLAIDAIGSEFILIDDRENGISVFKTRENIIAENIKTTAGEPATTKIETLTWDDEETLPKLQNLASMHLNSLIFLTGTIEVDFPEDINIQFSPNELQTLRISGMSVTLEYCPVEIAIAHLRDQWAIGQVQAKVISPSPAKDAG